MEFLEKLSLAGLVPVIAVNDADDAVPLCKALSDGGLPVAEITFRTAAAEEAIRRVHEAMPDVLLCCSNICSCMIKWYENLARELNIPMILLDIPFNPDYEVSDAEVAYVTGQFWDAVHQLEEITGTYPGVEKSYAIQAGREVRVMVKPEEVNEDNMILLAHDLAKKIESELEYPGQIKINVIRETKAIDYAK